MLEAKGPSLDKVLSLRGDHVKETIQWCPLTPAGSTHFTEDDDVTAEEAGDNVPRIMLSITASRLDLANPPALVTALSSTPSASASTAPATAASTAAATSEPEWTAAELADPFGPTRGAPQGTSTARSAMREEVVGQRARAHDIGAQVVRDHHGRATVRDAAGRPAP